MENAIQEKRHMGKKAQSAMVNTIIYIVLVLMSIIWLVPYAFIILQSFHVETPTQFGKVLPAEWGFDNYIYLFKESSFPRWFLTTFIMGLIVAVIQTVMVLSMSYTLSRLRFKGRKFLMNFMLVLGMFPGFLTMIVLYRILSDLKLYEANAMWGLIIVYVASSGMGYYVSKGFFDTIPRSLDEAARVDGATRAQIFFKIIMPLAKPIVIYTILTAFMAPWGDFIFARYIAHQDPQGYNVAVGLWSWLQPTMRTQYYTRFCAGAVVISIPLAALFLSMQKCYTEGLSGSVKG